MVHKPVNCRPGGHWVLEDISPLGKYQVAGDYNAPGLVPGCKQHKENVSFIPIVWDIADVIDDQCVAPIKFLDHLI